MHNGVGAVPHLTGIKVEETGGKPRFRGKMTEALMLTSAWKETAAPSHMVKVEDDRGDTFSEFWRRSM